MAIQKAQADVRINRLHYALPGWAKGRRDAQEDFYENAQVLPAAVAQNRVADRAQLAHFCTAMAAVVFALFTTSA